MYIVLFEYNNRFISKEGVISQKGRVACELSSGDEIVVSEMMFDGMFNKMNEDQIVALLSCFVHQVFLDFLFFFDELIIIICFWLFLRKK